MYPILYSSYALRGNPEVGALPAFLHRVPASAPCAPLTAPLAISPAALRWPRTAPLRARATGMTNLRWRGSASPTLPSAGSWVRGFRAACSRGLRIFAVHAPGFTSDFNLFVHHAEDLTHYAQLLFL